MFYPKEARTAEARIRYYADHFSTVEVDSTYYAIPDIKNTFAWGERTPDNFIFHIKAYGALTGHGIDPLTLPQDLRDMLSISDVEKKRLYVEEPSLVRAIADKFRESIVPLMTVGKLGMLVISFPPWFHFSRKNMDYILKCAEMFSGMKIAVEFRHGSWLVSGNQGNVFRFLRENRITYITADEPQYKDLSTVPFVCEATTDTAYFRFHGRNRDNWNRKGIEAALRFAYNYSDEELKEFIPSIRSVAGKAKETYVMFNNCYGDFAVRNAMEMKEALRNANQAHISSSET